LLGSLTNLVRERRTIGRMPACSTGYHMSHGNVRLRTASNACMLRSPTVNRPGTNGSYINGPGA
jgi:hypothetical protein